jgi:hypothetical protein
MNPLKGRIELTLAVKKRPRTSVTRESGNSWAIGSFDLSSDIDEFLLRV